MPEADVPHHRLTAQRPVAAEYAGYICNAPLPIVGYVGTCLAEIHGAPSFLTTCTVTLIEIAEHFIKYSPPSVRGRCCLIL